MSSNLVWTPVKEYSGILDDELKFALKNSDRFNQTIDRNFDESDLSYLRGLKDGGVKGADKLIKLIEKHKIVHVEEQW